VLTIPGHSEQVVNEKQDISSGHSSDEPVGHGSLHDESASSFDLPQKNVDEMPVSGVGAGEPSLQEVNGMHDSPEGHSLEEPDGHGLRHFSFASARSRPQ
jgi:hypothetical protein